MEASARTLVTPEVGHMGSVAWGRSSYLSCTRSSISHNDPMTGGYPSPAEQAGSS